MLARSSVWVYMVVLKTSSVASLPYLGQWSLSLDHFVLGFPVRMKERRYFCILRCGRMGQSWFFVFASKIRTHTATVELTEELPLIATPAPESALPEEPEEERE